MALYTFEIPVISVAVTVSADDEIQARQTLTSSLYTMEEKDFTIDNPSSLTVRTDWEGTPRLVETYTGS